MLRAGIAFLLCPLLLLLTRGASPGAEDTRRTYPIWVSSTLKVDPADPASLEAYESKIFGGTNIGCKLFLRSDIRAQAQTTLEVDAVHGIERGCNELRLLRQIKPARESYLHDYSFSSNSFAELPPCFGGEVEREGVQKAEVAVRSGASWLSYHGRPKKFQAKGTVLETETDVDRWFLEILAKGDLNGAGLEDMLIGASSHAIGGTYKTTGLLVLTRKRAEKFFRLIEAPGQNCPRTLDIEFQPSPPRSR